MQPTLKVGAAALLLATVAFVAALYIAAADRYAGARTMVTAQQADLGKLNDSLRAKQDELAKATVALDDARTETEELKRQQQVISTCLRLLAGADEAAQQGDVNEARARVVAATPLCDEADKYLDPSYSDADLSFV